MIEASPHDMDVEAYDTSTPEHATPFDLGTEETKYFDWNDGWAAAAEVNASNQEGTGQ